MTALYILFEQEDQVEDQMKMVEGWRHNLPIGMYISFPCSVSKN